ncbi:hypothetical protein SLEP1_g23838 [Rubroshorea leprosula]|uniref:Uncharacterized protein n=1 Tax=Rubroshorea leprosula TaxID=152421 RepID=A0AAV5JJW4_9ROSI|nr:hypothetical protein SLEP1_g23838 [Rubroshorea leprosula]
MARSCSHGHTGGVSSVPEACNAALRSASARIGASTSMDASISVVGSVDAGMWDAGVDVATRGCGYDTYVYEDAAARWIAEDAAGLASGGVDTGAVSQLKAYIRAWFGVAPEHGWKLHRAWFELAADAVQARCETRSELGEYVVQAWWKPSCEREIVTMASKGMEASNVLEEERVRWETRGDARPKRRSRAVSLASLDVETTFEGRLADRELATGDVHEQHVTLNSEEDGGGTVEPLEGKLQSAFDTFMANMSWAVEGFQGYLASSGGRDKPRRTSSPCGGMETTRDGSDKRPKRKHGCFLCGGPHRTRECPRRDALNAIIRAGEESSHTGEVSHKVKSEPGEAEDVASISHHQWQRQGSHAAKPEESGHMGETKPEEARDVAQDAGDSRQQQDVDAETCGNLREGSRHSTQGALTRESRALVGESVTARELGGRSRGHHGTELQPRAHRGCVQRPGGIQCSVAKCEREDRHEHEHGRQQKRSRKHGCGHVGGGCRCRDTGLRLRHVRIRGRSRKVDRGRRSGPYQWRRRYRGRGVKLRTGRVETCWSSRRRLAGVRESVLARDTSARGSGQGRPRCKPCQQQTGVDQNSLEATGHEQYQKWIRTCTVPDRGLEGLFGPSPTWGFSWAL